MRERVFAQYFGIGAEADAFGAAMKIPNVIRNLLGEGTLSASFIPVYAGMIERGETEDAKRLAHLLRSLPCKLNIIAFNPFPSSSLKRPTDAEVEAFGDIIRKAGINVTIRRSRGLDIGAACGQLDAEKDRK